jgi:hypothetical protein
MEDSTEGAKPVVVCALVGAANKSHAAISNFEANFISSPNPQGNSSHARRAERDPE